ncbi:hypothetical protein B0H63DRAFT_556881 [Podospora didyma]|uniref:non-specific serine/threonine protein kinase n=1 Tax=Podospora didyma TaxID=330526 RepID=A0AAE0NY37_9PEZI|nr:hypothetical protein B0H63DRAFT_556881 [Podospora didyma]
MLLGAFILLHWATPFKTGVVELRAALKVKSASTSTLTLAQDPEIKVLKKLEKYYIDTDQRTPRFYVQLLDSFRHNGPSGTHNCIVTELLGPSLATALGCYHVVGKTLRPDTVLRTARWPLEGLEMIHRAGIAHGDISPANLAFTCRNAQDDDDCLFEVMGRKPVISEYKSEFPRPSNLPKQLIKSVDWSLWYLGPLPSHWLAKWEEMVQADKYAEENAKTFADVHELIQDTFEPRRQEIIQNCNNNPEQYEKDEYSESDFAALKCLLQPIRGLLQHGPEKRISLQLAASYIAWRDYSRDDGDSKSEED